MRRTRRSSVLLRLSAVLLAGITAAGAQEIDSRKEAALGRELAGEFGRCHPPLDSAAAQEYVERVGRQLAAQFSAGPAAWTFAVISGDTNRIHEPAWFPAGYVFVPAALFLAAQDEAELAAMLAHSMAHVAERHAIRMANKGEASGLVSIPLIFVGGWTGNGDDALVPVGFLKFARAYELEADHLAVQVMAKAGYDPAALPRYLGRVQVDPAGKYSALPDRDARLAAFQGAIAELPPRAYHSSGGDFPRIRGEVQSLSEKEKPDRPPTLRR